MTTAPSGRGGSTASSVAHRAVLAVLVLSQVLQHPGRTTFDTKLDLTVSPVRLLETSAHLWNPLLSFGEIQNQAYGYLFPLGSFFALGDVAGLPPWLVQRLWSALVLVAAFEGARRLHRALAPSTSAWIWLLAGLAYALAPRTVGLVGVLSAEALPAAVLPWMALPLVHAATGRYTAGRAAGLSGLAFLCVGGVNATAAVAILPLPALLILFSRGPGSRLRLAVWWCAAVFAASAWWVLPLLVLGRYSPPFLDVIETARATTAPLGWVNVVRGLDHWLFFAVIDGEPWWAGASTIATSPVLILTTAAVSAVAFGGLLHPRMPARLPLAASAMLGVALMAVGHDGFLASPASGLVRELLDGSLAALRNVHKVDPIVRLALALGLAHGVGLLAGCRRRPATGRGRQRTRPLARAGIIGLSLLVVATAYPLFTGTARQPGWRDVPDEWRQVASYLDVHSDAGRTWVLPGTGFGRQTWGRTVDEPLQPLARAAWVTRSQVPLVPQQTMRYLDALEARVSNGRGSPGLADALARAGIGHVVVRHDLDVAVTTTPPADRVGAALDQSGGLTRVKTFVSDKRTARIDVYRVDRRVAPVGLTAIDGVARLSGGPEDVVSLIEGGVLSPSRAAALLPTDSADLDAVGDGFQRRERQFGRTFDGVGPLMTADEPFRQKRTIHDFAGPEGVQRVTASSPSGARATASSSSGYVDSVGPVRAELGPAAAVDGSVETMWRSAPLARPEGQWLELSLAANRPVDHVDVTAGVDGFSGTPVRRIRVTAGGQSVEQDVDPASGFARVRLSGAPVSTVRVTVTAVAGPISRGVVALKEVALPGLEAGQHAVLPGDGVGPGTDLHFRADPGRRACTQTSGDVRCDPELARLSDESTGLRRVFTTTAPGTWDFSGTATASGSPATLELLDPTGGAARVRASSVLSGDPLVAPAFAHDADLSTRWVSAVGDPAPTLTLAWEDKRTVSGLRIHLGTGPGRLPRTAVLTAAGAEREIVLREDGLVTFPPVQTAEVTLRFPVGAEETDAAVLPLVIAEVELEGIQDLTHRPDRSARTGAVCGLGPAITIDGRSIDTEVRGTLADVLDGTPLDVLPCSTAGPLRSGEHRLTVTPTDRFTVTSMTMTAQGPPEPVTAPRSFSVEQWEDTHRVVTVAAGNTSVLRVAENTNPGWLATLDGEPLETMVLDGWQQGYVVPAGTGGRIDLQFTPDVPYRAGLLGGALLAFLLVTCTVVVTIRSRRRPAAVVEEPRWTRLEENSTSRAVLMAGSALIGGLPLAAGALAGAGLRSRPSRRLVLGVATLVGAGLIAAVGAAAGQGNVFEPADLVAGLGLGLLLSALPTPSESSPEAEEPT